MSKVMPKPNALGPPQPLPLAPQANFESENHSIETIINSTNHIWTDELKIRSKISQYNYKLLLTNIRSLNRNFTEIESLVSKYKPDLVCLSEIWDPYTGGHISSYGHVLDSCCSECLSLPFLCQLT